MRTAVRPSSARMNHVPDVSMTRLLVDILFTYLSVVAHQSARTVRWTERARLPYFGQIRTARRYRRI